MKVVYAIVNERDIDHSVANKHDGLSLMAKGVQKQKNATAQCMWFWFMISRGSSSAGSIFLFGDVTFVSWWKHVRRPYITDSLFCR